MKVMVQYYVVRITPIRHKKYLNILKIPKYYKKYNQIRGLVEFIILKIDLKLLLIP